MKTIKFLCIAIFGMCFSEIYGMLAAAPALDFNTIFALNTNIPGSLQPKQHNNNHPIAGAPNRRCVYFTVIHNAPGVLPVPAAFHAAVAAAPNPANEHNIYFPSDGSQPTTPDAAQWACANVHDARITNWYVKAFGGETGLALSLGHQPPNFDAGPKVGVLTPQHALPINIITVELANAIAAGVNNFDQQFWRAFRIIAANPIGRVLLYRILIEIRRQNANGGCCEDGINVGNFILGRRNACRSIVVKYSDNGCSFVGGSKRTIKFDPHDVMAITVKLRNLNGNALKLETDDDPNDDTHDIGIFHEMLHWFHFLRNPLRYHESNSINPKHYKYLLRCYYGDHHEISEVSTWDGFVDDEEIRTILGTPNYNNPPELALIDYVGTFLPNNPPGNIHINLNGQRRHVPSEAKFLEGDDLSENVYRMSKTIPLLGNARYKMRFGHGDAIEPIIILNNGPIPRRFRLAHLVATTCYLNITGALPHNWNLVHGQAAQ